jgi:hypothetical protein
MCLTLLMNSQNLEINGMTQTEMAMVTTKKAHLQIVVHPRAVGLRLSFLVVRILSLMGLLIQLMRATRIQGHHGLTGMVVQTRI